MKFPKLLKMTQKILSDTQQEVLERTQNLKEIQLKLKKKAKKLKEKLEHAQDEATKKSLSQKLSVVTAQRKKVISELRKLDQDSQQ